MTGQYPKKRRGPNDPPVCSYCGEEGHRGITDNCPKHIAELNEWKLEMDEATKELYGFDSEELLRRFDRLFRGLQS